MKKSELNVNQVIQLGSDLYRVVNTEITELGFNAQRLIKTRQTWTKQPSFLKFTSLERAEVVA